MSKTQTVNKQIHTFSDAISTMAHASSDIASAFEKLYTTTLNNGKFPQKFKELIAITIAIASASDESLRNHIRSGIESGLTREELIEGIGVVILMKGENAFIYSAKALTIYDSDKNSYKR
ncbi:carboxymuconolactone decarboxylase family protein [Xenorhabdus khoisanae]|uniref:carboxymuconolactone decarboxylase family protein n=1 Tax=Xenorhabdus khoisanae TaxID=880157 RepID=UPI0023598C2C|nr:carboxymuconolactone decarboxylase family protein [Xenorhabdus khoisanae]MDC9613497.1 carboxymuconolactone decarboxylase family protein [Xenorhabdus khoisanae]